MKPAFIYNFIPILGRRSTRHCLHSIQDSYADLSRHHHLKQKRIRRSLPKPQTKSTLIWGKVKNQKQTSIVMHNPDKSRLTSRTHFQKEKYTHYHHPCKIKDLENRVDNVTTNTSTSTKDSSIPQLFSKLLSHFTAFSWGFGSSA